MEWYCGMCPKNKEKCDFCKAILSDRAELYADGKIDKAYRPASGVELYLGKNEINEFSDINMLGAQDLKKQYPDEYMRNAEIYEAHYQVGKETFNNGNFELSMNFFQNILDYKDSNEYYKQAKFAFEKQNRKITEQKYEEAIALYEKAEIEKARELFYELGDYLDSKQRYEKLNSIHNSSIRAILTVFGVLFFLIIVVLIFF